MSEQVVVGAVILAGILVIVGGAMVTLKIVRKLVGATNEQQDEPTEKSGLGKPIVVAIAVVVLSQILKHLLQ